MSDNYTPTAAEVEIAAKLMWKERALGTTTPEYPWRGLAEEGRERLREHAREVLTVALAAHDAATEEMFKKAEAFDKAVSLSERRQTRLEEAEAKRDAAVAALEQLRSGLESASYYEYKPHKASSDLIWAVGVINAALDVAPDAATEEPELSSEVLRLRESVAMLEEKTKLEIEQRRSAERELSLVRAMPSGQVQSAQLARDLRAERDAALAAIERVRAAKHEVDSVHQIHGADCLCGYSSARSRSRTEHITEAMLAALDGGDSGE